MEGRNRVDSLHLVDMAAGRWERLSQQRLRRAFAEQQQPLRPGERDVTVSDLYAGLALRRAHPGSGRMKAGKRGAVRLAFSNADPREHPFRKLPRLAADRLTGCCILDRR